MPKPERPTPKLIQNAYGTEKLKCLNLSRHYDIEKSYSKIDVSLNPDAIQKK